MEEVDLAVATVDAIAGRLAIARQHELGPFVLMRVLAYSIVGILVDSAYPCYLQVLASRVFLFFAFTFKFVVHALWRLVVPFLVADSSALVAIAWASS